MKKIVLISSLSMLCLLSNLAFAQNGSFRIRADEFTQIGYNNYKVLTLGQGNPSYPNDNNGAWGIEHWNGGLNFFRAWPVFSYGNYKLFIKDWDGAVGIGKYPVYKLDVAGDIATNGTLQIASDERLKTNIMTMDGASSLSLITSLKSYTYNYKLENTSFFPPLSDDVTVTTIKTKTMEGDQISPNTRLRRGFIAQEVKEIIPDLVQEAENGEYSIDYVSVIPILVEAMKEQQKIILDLQKEVEILKQK